MILSENQDFAVKNEFPKSSHVSLKEIVELCEKEAIQRELKNYPSLRKTAKALGISHTALINKCKKYNIQIL